MAAKEKPMAVLILFIIVVILLLSTVIYIKSTTDDSEESEEFLFPQSIGDLFIESQYSDEQAKIDIKNMHMGDFNFSKGYIAVYEDDLGKSAYFWVSEFETKAEAKETTERMTDKIFRVDTPFSNPTEQQVNSSEIDYVYYTYGIGQDHYYWNNGRLVIWMALTDFSDVEGKVFLEYAVEKIQF
jgi:hypothetical protein